MLSLLITVYHVCFKMSEIQTFLLIPPENSSSCSALFDVNISPHARGRFLASCFIMPNMEIHGNLIWIYRSFELNKFVSSEEFNFSAN